MAECAITLVAASRRMNLTLGRARVSVMRHSSGQTVAKSAVLCLHVRWGRHIAQMRNVMGMVHATRIPELADVTGATVDQIVARGAVPCRAKMLCRCYESATVRAGVTFTLGDVSATVLSIMAMHVICSTAHLTGGWNVQSMVSAIITQGNADVLLVGWERLAKSWAATLRLPSYLTKKWVTIIQLERPTMYTILAVCVLASAEQRVVHCQIAPAVSVRQVRPTSGKEHLAMQPRLARPRSQVCGIKKMDSLHIPRMAAWQVAGRMPVLPMDHKTFGLEWNAGVL